MTQTDHTWQIWIDTGGTFTDCLAVDPQGAWHRCKVLSNGALRGTIRRKLSATSFEVELDQKLPDQFLRGFSFRHLSNSAAAAEIGSFDAQKSVLELDREIALEQPEGLSFEAEASLEAPILAAHLVTETPLDTHLPPLRMRLATTKGTNTLLEQKGAPTALFVTEGFKDLLKIGNQQRPDLFTLQIDRPAPLCRDVVEVPERLNAKGDVVKELEVDLMEEKVENLLARGVESAAISLMHSYQDDNHEKKLARWLKKKGFTYISLSSATSKFIKILPRTETTLVDAYLNPVINNYLDHVEEHIERGSLHVMSSAGGLEAADNYNPKDSLLSGPAGGVVGAAAVGEECGFDRIISFDMGGTSTDVSRYDGGFDYDFEHGVGNTRVVSPSLSIETVAAGGGSVCAFDGKALKVGPESAGADPGPACYGVGGPLTVTDVNLLLGRIDPENFGIPLDYEAASTRFDALYKKIENASHQAPDRIKILQGLLDIANERMANTIRKISIRKGYDIQNYAMVGFGGAGGQHACAIADSLNIDNIIIPPDAGLLSAYGLGQAVHEKFAERQLLTSLHHVSTDFLEKTLEELARQARQRLVDEGVRKNRIEIRRRLLFMRLEGQESTLKIEYDGSSPRQRFKEKYESRYGHWIERRSIEVESVRVVASSLSPRTEDDSQSTSHAAYIPSDTKTKPVYFDGVQKQANIYSREQLSQGARIEGPALVFDPYSTMVIPPAWTARILPSEHMHVKRKNAKKEILSSKTASPSRPESAKVELFTNRFTSIAEEMGEMLQRTALSVNVKERLDFSCGLLDARGRLIVNAPHIPVHLGALGLCVREVSKSVDWSPGDAVITNHPAYGGSHLPDVTLITPIFTEQKNLAGFAASRAHHAEIGGRRPGSMPPDATSLAEEGVVIPPTYLLKRGESNWKEVRSVFMESDFPSRSIEENMADLRAALAANQRGITLMKELLNREDNSTIQYYMETIRQRAEHKTRQVLQQMDNGTYQATEYLDDGTPLQVAIHVQDEEITFDFQGSGARHAGNLNATPAIVNSVVTYFMRLLVKEDLPLNEGLLAPVELHLPQSLLNPAFSRDPHKAPAVVGGNTETSQRLVDTLLRPFGLMACSQGTMNNVLFGNEEFGYYETIGGGSGAGPSFDGATAVHHHMTNTRATDPEILEYRYPVRLLEYGIRQDSGGSGRNRGGDGIERHYLFLDAVELSVLTQHRRYAPYGLNGGKEGARGEQFIIRKDGTRKPLASIDEARLESGDRFIIKTPGGGGYGRKTESGSSSRRP